MFVALAGVTLTGSRVLAVHQLPHADFIAMTSLAVWIRAVILFVLPILLLVLLWRLVRPTSSPGRSA